MENFGVPVVQVLEKIPAPIGVLLNSQLSILNYNKSGCRCISATAFVLVLHFILFGFPEAEGFEALGSHQG